MGLGWDSEAQTIVVELLAVSDTEFDASVVLDDAEEGPDAVRVFLTRSRHASSPPARTGSSPRAARRARCVTNRWTRRAISACAPTDTCGGPVRGRRRSRLVTAADESSDREVLRRGELTVLGRIRSASNATFLCEAADGERTVHCVYKPVAGEQPLWDFPTARWPAGNSAPTWSRPRSAGTSCRTIIRDGPAGPGMLQRWVDQPEDTQDAETAAPTGPQLVDLCPADSVPSRLSSGAARLRLRR